MKSCIAAFWSPFHGQCCTTSNAVAAAVFLSLTHNIRTLIMHSQFAKSNMETAFYSSDEENGIFEETGIDAVVRLARAGQLSADSFPDYTKALVTNRLDILPGTTKSNLTEREKVSGVIQYILSCARQAYDIVILDCNAGTLSDITKKCLDMADIIIINLNQNIEVLNSYFNKIEWMPVLDVKKNIVVIGNYDENSRYSLSAIKKRFNYQQELLAIPHSTNFMDYYNDSNIIEFFMSNQNIDSRNENYSMISEVAALLRKIFELLEIDAEGVLSPYENKSVFDYILKLFK